MADTKFVDYSPATPIVADWLNDVNDLVYGLGKPNGASLSGYRNRTVAERLDDVINVLDHGVKGDGVTNDTAAFIGAISLAKTQKKALVIPETAASYLLTAGAVNFSGSFLSVIGLGMPTLKYVGAGVAFSTDAGAGINNFGMRVENLRIVGSAESTIGWESRGQVHGQFINIEIKDAGTSRGIRLAGSVLNTYNNVRVNSQGSTVHPFVYWYLDMADALNPDTRCQSNIFIDCLAEGIGAASTSIGFYLNYAVLNRFYGCVPESLKIGVEFATDTCRLNSFHGLDLEDNQQNDIILRGHNNSFYDCTIQSGTNTPNVSILQAHGSNFYGGYLRWADVSSSSTNTNFFGCGIDQNTGGGIGIQGGKALYTMRGCSKINNVGLTVGAYPDVTGNGGQTVKDLTSSRALGVTYTNDTGSPINIYVMLTLTSGAIAEGIVGGHFLVALASDGSASKDHTMVMVVPAGATYRVQQGLANVTLSRWSEIRA